MAVELKVPEVGESVTEVEIGKWLKGQGDQASKDDPLVEIETDKITLELPSPVDGQITQLLKQQGEPASVGDVIGYIEQGQGERGGGSATAAQSQAKTEEAASQQTQPAAKAESPAATEQPAESTSVQSSQAQPMSRAEGGGASDPADSETRIMPAAQRLIDERGVEIAQLHGTGPGGRILKEDVQRFLNGDQSGDGRTAEGSAKQTPPGREPTAPPSAPAPSPQQAESAKSAETQPGREEQTIPMTPLRRSVAKRLTDVQRDAALLTTFNEVDMTEVKALRSRYRDDFEKKHNVKLGFMSFFVRACISALMEFPAVNAEVRDEKIVYKNYYDLGIAIGGGKGLVVPILRNAERMSFADIENQIDNYARKVKENRLELDALQGGTFTITNGGVFGSLLSTPIVNPPQSAVLGMHTIQDRPVAIEGQVVVRPMMYLALTYDHRLVDGREAVTFLRRIKETIEQPARMLMEV